jgi:hypothetical protein
MAYEFTGTERLDVTRTISGFPRTYAMWLYPTTTASGTNRDSFISLSTPSFHLNTIRWFSTNGTTNTLQAVSSGTNGTFTAAGPTTFGSNQWVHLAAVFTSATSRQAYLDGTSGTVNTANIGTQESTVNIRVGANAIGRISESAVWSAALSADEIASLAKGVTCNLIRPQSLIYYVPLIRNLQDVKGGLTITNLNGATVADHPRVYK